MGIQKVYTFFFASENIMYINLYHVQDVLIFLTCLTLQQGMNKDSCVMNKDSFIILKTYMCF